MAFEPIDFSEYDKNKQADACDNHLSIFRRSPVMLEFREALVKQSQEFYDANIATLSARTIAEATGSQLDVIGQIVGQTRVPFNASDSWLTADLETTLTDVSPIWLVGESIGAPLADDDQYLIFIKAKIFKNHVRYGSIPEIIAFVALVFEVNISVKKLGNDEINIVIPVSFPPEFIPTLLGFVDDETADAQYFLPIPTGCRIAGAEIVPLNPFRVDVVGAGPDLGLLSVASGGLI